MMEPPLHTPAPIAVGRSADVYALSGGRVLKLFFSDYPATEIDLEERNAVKAFEIGATPIACHGKTVRDGRTGLIFDALEGVSVTELSEKAPVRLRMHSRALARTHAALHRLPGKSFPELRERLASLLETPAMSFLSAERKAAAERYLLSLRPGDALLHMDYHSSNVFEHQGRRAVIDWATALQGAPAADVAATLFLYKDAELWPGTPWLKKRFFAIARRVSRSAYLSEYLRLTGLTLAEIEAWRLPVLIHRLAVWDIPSERTFLQNEIRSLTKEAS